MIYFRPISSPRTSTTATTTRTVAMYSPRPNQGQAGQNFQPEGSSSLTSGGLMLSPPPQGIPGIDGAERGWMSPGSPWQQMAWNDPSNIWPGLRPEMWLMGPMGPGSPQYPPLIQGPGMQFYSAQPGQQGPNQGMAPVPYQQMQRVSDIYPDQMKPLGPGQGQPGMISVNQIMHHHQMQQQIMSAQQGMSQPPMIANGPQPGPPQQNATGDPSGPTPPPGDDQVFSADVLRQHMRPIWEKLDRCDDAIPFRVPVEAILLGIPDYLDIVKHPMDLSTICHKLNRGKYRNVWEFCDDMWLMFDNAWLYNEKNSEVYNYATRLSELFVSEMSPVMKRMGYCCADRLTITALPLFCYGATQCIIARDQPYMCYERNTSQYGVTVSDRYTYCLKCFETMIPAEGMPLSDDPNDPNRVPKTDFKQLKNNQIDYEPFETCKYCKRKWHRICALHDKKVFPEGFICMTCREEKSLPKSENTFTAKLLGGEPVWSLGLGGELGLANWQLTPKPDLRDWEFMLRQQQIMRLLSGQYDQHQYMAREQFMAGPGGPHPYNGMPPMGRGQPQPPHGTQYAQHQPGPQMQMPAQQYPGPPMAGPSAQQGMSQPPMIANGPQPGPPQQNATGGPSGPTQTPSVNGPPQNNGPSLGATLPNGPAATSGGPGSNAGAATSGPMQDPEKRGPRKVKAIFPSLDPETMQDQRFPNLISYAREAEKEMFEMADDRKEYYHPLAVKIYKIQKKLQEKKAKRLNDQQLGTLPITVQQAKAIEIIDEEKFSKCAWMISALFALFTIAFLLYTGAFLVYHVLQDQKGLIEVDWVDSALVKVDVPDVVNQKIHISLNVFENNVGMIDGAEGEEMKWKMNRDDEGNGDRDEESIYKEEYLRERISAPANQFVTDIEDDFEDVMALVDELTEKEPFVDLYAKRHVVFLDLND
ncbi:unnamed protein product, partial [Mesorhabditis belari]|uniref:histone acetyltransferase n=1 Tax=Mesorhabditis belari TaxID=2138241 RepID=A0AAF3EA90_9BILA